MAQVGRGPRGGGLARRFGVFGRAGVAVALVALLLGGAAFAVLGPGAESGVVIERSDGQGLEAAEAGEREEAGDGGDDAEGDGGAEGEPTAHAPEPATLVVHVDGAVAAPGVYVLSGEPRVNDAILAAGGLTAEADTTGINLAAALADGEKVHVPAAGEASAPATSATGPGAGVSGGEPAVVNINTAGVEDLDSLPGVGEATARAIIEDRERNGPFAAPEDLMRVSGIGEKKFEKLAGRICV